MSRLVSAALLSCLLAACGGEDLGPEATGADAGPAGPMFVFDDVYGVPNLDNDDASQRDWDQPLFAGDNDLSVLVLPGDRLALAGSEVQLSLSGDTDLVRVYRGGELLLGAGASTNQVTLAVDGSDVELAIEFGDYLARAELSLSGGDQSTSVRLQAAPLIMNHHLQPAEHVWVVRYNFNRSDNESMVNEFATTLGSKFTAVPGSSVGRDVWIQDEYEFSTATGAGGQRLNVVIDSIRNRGLQGYAQSAWVRPDTIAQTWGNPQFATTYDSFGNLEASPPVTVNGVSYPFGKIYYGRVGNAGLNTALSSFLASQRVQAPFELPTNWLCVGHVDEFSSFVPDPSSPKGFKLVMADVRSAWELLAALPSNRSIPLYGQDHGYSTVGALRGDANLVALNNEIQETYLDPITETFKAELGLTDEDIIRIPSLFEQVGGCNGRVAALVPGMVNLVVADFGQGTHIFTADPFFRSTNDPSTDPFITAFTQAMPAGTEIHYVDDWDVYHLGLGEVHCGTNVRRTPTASWWTDALHLVESN